MLVATARMGNSEELACLCDCLWIAKRPGAVRIMFFTPLSHGESTTAALALRIRPMKTAFGAVTAAA